MALYHVGIPDDTAGVDFRYPKEGLIDAGIYPLVADKATTVTLPAAAFKSSKTVTYPSPYNNYKTKNTYGYRAPIIRYGDKYSGQANYDHYAIYSETTPYTLASDQLIKTIKLTGVVRNSTDVQRQIDLYLCDQEGKNRVYLNPKNNLIGSKDSRLPYTSSPDHDWAIGPVDIPEATAKKLVGRIPCIYFACQGATYAVHIWNVSVSYGYVNTYKVTLGSATGGKITINKTTYARNETGTITVTPNTGYRLKTLLANGGTLTKNSNGTYTFKMGAPAKDTTITPTWEKVPYTINKIVTPNKAGILTVICNYKEVSTAGYKDVLQFLQEPASAEYRFEGFNIDGGNPLTQEEQTVINNQISTLKTQIRQAEADMASRERGSPEWIAARDAKWAAQTDLFKHKKTAYDMTETNTYTMPQKNITVTAGYLKHDMQWIDPELSIRQVESTIYATLGGFAVDNFYEEESEDENAMIIRYCLFKNDVHVADFVKDEHGVYQAQCLLTQQETDSQAEIVFYVGAMTTYTIKGAEVILRAKQTVRTVKYYTYVSDVNDDDIAALAKALEYVEDGSAAKTAIENEIKAKQAASEVTSECYVQWYNQGTQLFFDTEPYVYTADGWILCSTT